MTIIDRKAGISYPGMSVKQSAQLVGVAKMTLYRWEKLGKMQEFNQFLIIFREINVKIE